MQEPQADPQTPVAQGGHPLDSKAHRILYIDHTAKLGGGEIALLHLVQHLDRERFTPIVLLSSDGPLRAKLQESGIEVHLLLISDSILESRKDALGLGTLLRLRDIALLILYSVRLARFIRENRIDLVHTNSLKADILGGVAARLASVPLLWHVRDRIDRDYLPGPVASVFRWLCRWLPDYVVANSESTLDTLNLRKPGRAAAVYSGIDLGSRSYVVHDGVRNLQGQAPRQAPIVYTGPHSAGLTATRPNEALGSIIGLVGRISPWKGQHIFLQAAAIVRVGFSRARFQIIGSAMFGEERYEQEIRDLAHSLGLDECVEFLGFRNDIPELVRDMSVLVHASTSAEPFGQVIVEGMAAAKPVVATNGGGATEIIVNGETGLLVPMADVEAMAEAITFLLANPEVGQEMGRRGYRRAIDFFTIERTVGNIERVYEQMFSRLEIRRTPGLK